jgi:holo-[acyl-carrier protein] synthase
MIVSVGCDLVFVPQLRGVLERRGERFLERVLTAGERAYCAAKLDSVRSVAARFAAKEAVMKVLGTGWAQGVSWQGIEVVREPGHAPQIRLHGRTAELARARGIAHIHLSLSHSGEYAQAFCVAVAGAAQVPPRAVTN